MKKQSAIAVSATAAAIVLVGALFVNSAWRHRLTTDEMRAARKEARTQLSKAKPEEVLPMLEKFIAEKRLRTWFEPLLQKDQQSPWRFWTLRLGSRPNITPDYVAQLSEELFIRFGGDGASKPADVKTLKTVLDFTDRLLKANVLSPDAAVSLRERRLDGFFLAGDLDGAITCLESGAITKRSPAWCKSTAAKLRYHKAEKAGQFAEAAKQLLVFIDFMLSDEQKDFEDCDPATSIVYSREWVVALNYVRCTKLMNNIKDAAKAKEYTDLAVKYYTLALEKAKDDELALAKLKQEIAEEKLPVVIPAAPEKKAAPAPAPAPEKKAAPAPAPAK